MTAAVRSALLGLLAAASTSAAAPRAIPRAHPPGPGHDPADDTGFFYVAYGQRGASSGAGATVTLAQPRLSTQDAHSLAEVAVESTDGTQIIEIGWTVDPGVNDGAIEPHLFIFHWVDGVGGGYNGFGFVPAPTARHAPGDALAAGSAAELRIEHRADAAWWLSYDGDDLGSFPDALWGGRYTQAGFVQWFGEVATGGERAPCTEMGDGKRGTDPDAASFDGAYLVAGSADDPATLEMTQLSNAAAYSQGRVTASGFGFGGPGIADPSCNYRVDPPPPVDAGPRADAGDMAMDSGGCCDAGGDRGGLALAALVGLAWIRRRRSS